MKSIGIIAEYNPFHNGHLYHINEIKKKYPDHIIILVMTGNFSQRGIPSIIDKFKRCEIALLHGIDLVVELPFPFSTQSADYFSYGAITILEKLNCEKVIFGSESNNIETLELIAKTQVNNPEFERLVKIYSKFGNNYPTSISKAIYDLTNKKIDTPNDLLGISYIKTIISNNYNIKYETIKRLDNYHDIELNDELSSATSIRAALKNNIDISKQVPVDTLNYFNDLHFIDDYFDILKYKIITEEDLTTYNTVEEGIVKLLKKKINNVSNYDELIKSVKSKRYTYNKISRMLLHILCNFTKDKKDLFNKISYLRILGFNDLGKSYLNSIKKNIDIPIISKITREKDKMLEYELYTTEIYNIINKSSKKEEESIIYLGGKNDKK